MRNCDSVFTTRHIGPSQKEKEEMLRALGCSSVASLLEETIPANIHTKDKSVCEKKGLEEPQALQEALRLAGKNRRLKSFLGMGYYGTHTPEVIKRNVLENPGWYTQYTPYQPEISQGRLESLLNFQTMIADLTGLAIANASLLDEATSAAEAMLLIANASQSEGVFFISEECFPQTVDVVVQRLKALSIPFVVGSYKDIPTEGVKGALLQNPTQRGDLLDYTETIKKLHNQGGFACVAADILSLVGIKSPGEMGADICVGSSQRFGVPMGFGGPSAAFFAVRDEFKRKMPGRIVGVSKNVEGDVCFRLTLQTREQHIRRDKATSNICTAQALLANMSAFYAIYHGYEGLLHIFNRVHDFTKKFSEALSSCEMKQLNETFFDRLSFSLDEEKAEKIYQKALQEGMNLWKEKNQLAVHFDETTTEDDLQKLIEIFTKSLPVGKAGQKKEPLSLLSRKGPLLTHPVFSSYRTETKLMRYIKKLEAKDLSLIHGMIPLGSCTMKLNSAVELAPLSWAAFSDIHPFVPQDQALGYHTLMEELKAELCRLTGFAAVSLQPNSGAQGEYAGLLVVKAYLADKGEKERNICLIPQSAHGTNPASAAMAGFEIVVVKCDARGNIDVKDLEEKAMLYSAKLALLMLTYPSTHGVFEESVEDICRVIHSHGGQVYLDGANFNAMVELCKPGAFGADLCHINLHKTFCIPHGGGGPGAGPIAVAKHLSAFLPGHRVIKTGGEKAISAVSASPYGSALLYVISWLYTKMMGHSGLKQATETAILNANYMATRLKEHYPILYTNKKGRVAHELILDLRGIAKESGIDCHDVAKRLMDFGFHAPTVSFPVAQTLMIEPTESEAKEELDRYCDALIAIKEEIFQVTNKKFDASNNPLKNAPHTETMLLSDSWDKPYSREKAAYPLAWVKKQKFWPKSSRIDEAYGDRNVFCTCPEII